MFKDTTIEDNITVSMGLDGSFRLSPPPDTFSPAVLAYID